MIAMVIRHRLAWGIRWGQLLQTTIYMVDAPACTASSSTVAPGLRRAESVSSLPTLQEDIHLPYC